MHNGAVPVCIMDIIKGLLPYKIIIGQLIEALIGMIAPLTVEAFSRPLPGTVKP
jgi:hypothetical protein